MLKKIVLLLCLVGLGALAGCTYSMEHNRKHWNAYRQDVNGMHKFIDKHFFNYDDDDPSRY
jgi:hypothetical protein